MVAASGVQPATGLRSWHCWFDGFLQFVATVEWGPLCCLYGNRSFQVDSRFEFLAQKTAKHLLLTRIIMSDVMSEQLWTVWSDCVLPIWFMWQHLFINDCVTKCVKQQVVVPPQVAPTTTDKLGSAAVIGFSLEIFCIIFLRNKSGQHCAVLA